MTASFDPLLIAQQIRDDYERYVETTFPIKNPAVHEQFSALLRRPGFLAKGPFLEITPPFKSGCSVRDLIAADILCKTMLRLDGPGMPDYGYPIDRSLYAHQDNAIAKTRADRNVVVATGTGSGKTESFLLPIIDYLLREAESDTLKRPGVRALILYPMNALANDQLKRLRRMLAKLPEITFGRYTGQTLDHRAAAEQDFHQTLPGEPLYPNELICRDDIREKPPHILLTNYAMLEYLLLRPKDTTLFDGPTAKSWRFIVVDEAHTYSGAAGMEVGMLLRRLKHRVAKSQPGALRCIATSATMGSGRADFPKVAHFAESLFGETFEWNENDPSRQDVVEPILVDPQPDLESWGKADSKLYGALDSQWPNLNAMAQAAISVGIPNIVVSKAVATGSPEAFLYDLLSRDERVRSLKTLLQSGPISLETPTEARKLFDATDKPPLPALISLVSLCSRAFPQPDAAPLISARYHMLVRALEGAFVTFPSPPDVQLHLSPVGQTVDKGISCQAFEIASCSRCGHAMLAGGLISDLRSGDGTLKAGPYLRALRSPDTGISCQKAFFSWGITPEGSIDEDEALLADAIPEPTSSESWIICAACGAAAPSSLSPNCSCNPERYIKAYSARLQDGRLAICPSCGAQDRTHEDVVRRFRTGQDAPVAVLASSLYQYLSPENTLNHPGKGRKLLTFSDSRQDAAYFAPYLQGTHQDMLQRRLIAEALALHMQQYGNDPARPDGLENPFLRKLSRERGIFMPPYDAGRERKERSTWIFKELLAFDRRLGLEGTGILAVRYTRPTGLKLPTRLGEKPYNYSDAEVWNLVEILLDSLRFSGCLDVEPADISSPEFEPRKRLVYCREKVGAQGRGLTIIGWLPNRDSCKSVSNRRFDYLMKVLARRSSRSTDEVEAMDLLEKIWVALTSSGLLKGVMLAEQKLGIAYHIDPSFIELYSGNSPTIRWLRCNSCHAVGTIAVDEICPTLRCQGGMLPFDPESELFQHHYRQLYLKMHPVPMEVREHTAQWGARKAAEIQQLFIDGKVNVLSCSTTFELGVDVGELQAVLMHNVPPTTANYVQRAGRAGRRTGTAAFALTYAQRRPHDLTHYAKPIDFICGKIKPPVVEICNPKIVRRHLHSVIFADYFRRHPRSYGTVESFFCSDLEANQNGPRLLEKMLQEKPAQILESLNAIIPNDSDVRSEIKLDTWGWIPKLIDYQENSHPEGMLGIATREVLGDLKEYDKLKAEAIASENFGLAAAFKRQADSIRKRHLLGFLASRNVLPKYGFPVDVVELRLKPSCDVAQELELERDLKIAISEYAPGGEVVAGHRVWKSTGIRRLPQRDPVEFSYLICPHCGRFHKSIRYEELPMNCQACGEPVHVQGCRAGCLVVPEYGFFSNEDPQRVGSSRPQRLYSSRVFFSEYPPNISDLNFRIIEPQVQKNERYGLRYRYSRNGKLVIVNSGIAMRGYRICKFCGYAEPAPLKPTKSSQSEHENAFGRPCHGMKESRHLGHEFLSDVLELRFDGKWKYDPESSLWWSLTYALLQGASDALGIDRRDLDGCLYPYGLRHSPPAIILYDNIPGGAGHARRIGDNLNAVMHSALHLAADCPSCAEDTSCYGCLKTYDNQFCHHLLCRGQAAQFLKQFVC